MTEIPVPSQPKFIQALDRAINQTGRVILTAEAVCNCKTLEWWFPARGLQAFGAGESMDGD